MLLNCMLSTADVRASVLALVMLIKRLLIVARVDASSPFGYSDMLTVVPIEANAQVKLNQQAFARIEA